MIVYHNCHEISATRYTLRLPSLLQRI